MEDLRHAENRRDQAEPHAVAASPFGGFDEGFEPEPTLLSIAAALDGMSRWEAAKIGGMDRQTLRDWVHRFNAHGPAGLKDNYRRGNPRRLSAARQAELAQIVETGPAVPSTAWCAGGALTSSASSRSASGLNITSAPSASCFGLWASRTSAPGRDTPSRMARSSRRSKKLPAHARGPSRRRERQEADRDLISGRSAHRSSDHVFGLFALIGRRFAPRLRNLKDRKFHTFEKGDAYPVLANHIGAPINATLILDHWDDLLHLAVSITTWSVVPSTSTSPKESQPARALRELGCFERSLFMIEWYSRPNSRG